MIQGTDIFATCLLWPGNAGMGGGAYSASMMDWPMTSPGTFNIGVQYKATAACAGGLVVHNCTFRPAVVRYPVSINGNTSTIALAAGTSMTDDQVLEMNVVPPVSPSVSSSFNESTYGGLFKFLSDTYDTSMSMDFGAIGFQIFNEGALANRYLNSSINATNLNCSLTFSDPMSDLIGDIRELMFRTSLASATTSEVDNVQHATAQ